MVDLFLVWKIDTPVSVFLSLVANTHLDHHWIIAFWFLVCHATTQLALQVQQERIKVVRSNR